MKIAYLVNQYPKVSHSFIRREIAALEALGHRVDRYSVRQTDSLVDEADRAEAERTTVLLRGFWNLLLVAAWWKLRHPIRWTRASLTALGMGWKSDRGVLRHLIYLMEAARLVADLEERPVDHLHVHFGTNSATVGLLTRMLGGPTWSFTVHGPEDFDKVAAIGLPRKLVAAEGVVAISSYCRSQLMRWMAAESWGKIFEVHCGLDGLFLEAEVVPLPERPRLVCVGRLCEQKGQLLLLEAIARVRDRGMEVELVLAGDGEMRGVIEQRVRELALDDLVTITGWVDAKRVRSEIESSRALVLPSFAEGLPVVLMEAMALGRPVVSTYIAGIPELVEDGENGWLVPAGDVEALTEALVALLSSDQEQLSAMGEKGREAVLERHDASKEARTLATAFERFGGRASS
ncbi:glycosyltransferase family 4 protein [Mucisphaera sp.]|uniref:glycosyltransferase family 4 protein n=1 Tax=Mucisphaera sp. TaxID=2913024 RepID=UPI003D1031F7